MRNTPLSGVTVVCLLFLVIVVMLVPPAPAWKAILLRVPRHASKALLLAILLGQSRRGS